MDGPVWWDEETTVVVAHRRTVPLLQEFIIGTQLSYIFIKLEKLHI
jgi:hypothetical protein